MPIFNSYAFNLNSGPQKKILFFRNLILCFQSGCPPPCAKHPRLPPVFWPQIPPPVCPVWPGAEACHGLHPGGLRRPGGVAVCGGGGGACLLPRRPCRHRLRPARRPVLRGAPHRRRLLPVHGAGGVWAPGCMCDGVSCMRA